jgi:molybdopterin-guanine dinucleotide biosynthesis protein A
VAPAGPASKTGEIMMDRPCSPCEAAVFVGGDGRRMGGDKPLRPLAGRPLAAWVVEALAGQGERVLLVARTVVAAQRLAAALRPTLSPAAAAALVPCADRPGLEGPVAALMGAADRARTPWLLTSPADTPFLPADLRARLAAAMGPDGAAAMAEADGWQHPTVALYATDRLKACPPRRSLRETIAPLAPRMVALAPQALFNVNTPADLAAAEAHAAALTTSAKRP